MNEKEQLQQDILQLKGMAYDIMAQQQFLGNKLNEVNQQIAVSSQKLEKIIAAEGVE